MTARCIVIGVTLGVALSGALPAQVSPRTAGREFGDAAKDILYTLASPVRGDRQDWLAAGAIGAGFVLLLPIDDDVDRWIADHQGSELVRVVKPFRKENKEGSRLGADSRLLPITGALIAAGLISNNTTLRDVGYGCLTTSLVSTTLRSAVYAGVSRTRPVTAGGDQFDVEVPGGEWPVHSFFSGHSMNAFGCATFLGTRYKLGAAEPLLYAVAASISFARMSDRYHWASDVYLGSLAGIAVGRTIARRALRREATRGRAGGAPPGAESWLTGLRASPVPGGVGVSWQRSF